MTSKYDIGNGWSAQFIGKADERRALHFTHTSGAPLSWISLILPPASVDRLRSIFREIDAQERATFRD